MSEILTREEYEDELLGPDGNQGWADVLLAHDAALRAENERLRFAIEREITFCEDEAASGHSAYEVTFLERAASLRLALEGKEPVRCARTR